MTLLRTRALCRAGRLTLVVLCSSAAFVVAGTTGCYYRAHHDSFCDDDDFDDDDRSDDDNEDCGDDDDGSVIVVLGQAEESYRLQDYRIEPSFDPREHPIARVVDVEGVSIFALLGPGTYGGEDFRGVSDRILLANDSLLGLPAHAGRRRFVGVEFAPGTIAVSYAQESDADGSWQDVPGASTVFRYDLSGVLASIENRISIAPLVR